MQRFTTNAAVYERLKTRYPDATRILAEGDSWLAYPPRYILWGRASNIVHHLALHAHKHNWTLYDISRSGDKLSDILGDAQRRKLRMTLGQDHFDILLFSGGGNDLVSNLDTLLRPKAADMFWKGCIQQDQIDARLRQICTHYRNLVSLVQEHSKNPKIRIVTHTYDYPDPSGKGFSVLNLELIKPWITPALVRAHITEKADQVALIGSLLSRYADAIQEVAGIEVVKTQETLTPDDWKDELHPTSGGFKKITARIVAALLGQVAVP